MTVYMGSSNDISCHHSPSSTQFRTRKTSSALIKLQILKMSTTQEKKQALVEHKVITDVLPGNIDLSYDLTVKWPETTLDKPGVELDREQTQPEPTLYLSPAVCQSPM
jgi:hypothetical protein